MNSELEVLKRIWENGGEIYSRLVSRQTGFGLDYVHYIFECLFQKGWVKPEKGKRDWYRITSRGKKELMKRQIIRLKKPRKLDVEKIVYYLPRKLKLGLTKSKPLKIKKKLILADEEKLNLGTKIQKAASSLNGRLKREI